MDPGKVAVIVGVGQVNAPEPGNPGPDAVDLMAIALRRADTDAGCGWLGRADFLGVENQISSAYAAWPGDAPVTPHVTAALGITPRMTFLTEEASGDGPALLLDMAAGVIANGEASVAAIVGGEGLRTAARRAAAEGGRQANAVQELLDRTTSPFLKAHGLVTPIDVYPLYESATRAAWGQTLDKSIRESSEMAEAYSRAAVGNEDAAIRKLHSADEIGTVSDRNRLITFPYTKLMIANSAVNQGAAVILTSLKIAREMGVPESAMVFVGSGAAAAEAEDFLARDCYSRSAAMTASITTAMERNGLAGADLDCIELYNCFPCVPKMARRVLGWPLERSPSVYGGLVFGGAPMGNCMMHALVMMTRRMRAGARNGLIFANGGFATHNHTIVLTRDVDRAAQRNPDFDVQLLSDSMRWPVPQLDATYSGAGRIEAYTVPYGKEGGLCGATIVGLTPNRRRFVALVLPDDASALETLISGAREPVGMEGVVTRSDDGTGRWSFA